MPIAIGTLSWLRDSLSQEWGLHLRLRDAVNRRHKQFTRCSSQLFDQYSTFS
ncbi:hypothetical protein [Aquiflexum sp.]|uniref:hypothetical protein n=1 Tax=Aquiflexum sp. TaxID=1872584 RepID=UPI003593032E